MPIQALRLGQQGSTILAGQSLLWWWLCCFPHSQSCTTWSRTGQRTGVKVFIRPFAAVEIITCQTPKKKTNPNKPLQMGIAYEPSTEMHCKQVLVHIDFTRNILNILNGQDYFRNVAHENNENWPKLKNLLSFQLFPYKLNNSFPGLRFLYFVFSHTGSPSYGKRHIKECMGNFKLSPKCTEIQ